MTGRVPGVGWPALVLTAGLGTRARPLTYERAKAALPVAGEPLVRRIVRQLHAGGVRDLVLNLHHLPASITGMIGDGSDLGVSVRYSWEMPLLGSAGGPRRALALLGSSPFFLINGDTLSDVDLGALAGEHLRTGALVTMAVVPNPAPDRYGGVAVDRDGVVRGFTRRGAADGSFHFVGVQAADAAAFAHLADGTPEDSVGRLYPRLITERPGSVRALVTDAAFMDVGTPAEYLATSLALAARERRAHPLAGARVCVASDAVVIDSILWDDVEVGGGCRLTRCIVADGVSIPAGARFDRCAIVRLDGRTPAHGERAVGQLLVRALET